jgi:hypothetical protein
MKLLGPRLTLVLVLLGCLMPLSAQDNSGASAVVPRLINYSGKVAEADGKPVAGVAGVTFSIYKDQEGGAALWMETQNVQADKTGRYTAQLGAASPNGLPAQLFASGEARWLGVQVSGQAELPRTLLLSVPYALKAADAQTLGGLPASAFMLAAPLVNSAPAGSAASTDVGSVSPSAATDVTTTGGSANFLPFFNGASTIVDSVVQQTGSGSTAKIGIGTSTPAATLDVKGSTTVRGLLNLPATSTATVSAGSNSNGLGLVASTFNSGTRAAANQVFHWFAEPVGNNTASPSATLNLLFATAPNIPAETGLRIASNGRITFAPGQTFPGTGPGTITGVTAGTALTGGGSSGSVTLNLDTTKVPQLNSANAFVGNQGVVGNVTVSGMVGIGTTTPSQALDLGNNNNMIIRVDPGSDTSEGDGGYALVGRGAGGVANTWWTFTAPVGGGFGVPANSYSIWQYPPNAKPGCCLNRLTILPAEASTDTGGTVAIDQNGDIAQPRTAGGTVKAMLFFSPFNGGRIAFCFNSTLSGAAATTPPCGFTFDMTGVGDYIFDLGFKIDDRFLSATVQQSALTVGACTDVNSCNNISALTPNSTEVTVYAPVVNQYYDDKVNLIVY